MRFHRFGAERLASHDRLFCPLLVDGFGGFIMDDLLPDMENTVEVRSGIYCRGAFPARRPMSVPGPNSIER